VRIAIDSPVLCAAHVSRAGVCAELLEDLLLHHELAISELILEQLCRKLVETFAFPAREADQVAALLRRASTVVSPADVPGTALAGRCALLISVDAGLLDMRTVHDIPIIRPGDYWRRITEIA
jgi:predicted nucleic acid-binding protein